MIKTATYLNPISILLVGTFFLISSDLDSSHAKEAKKIAVSSQSRMDNFKKHYVGAGEYDRIWDQGRIYRDQGKYDKALLQFEDLYERAAFGLNEKISALRESAITYEVMGEYENAANIYEFLADTVTPPDSIKFHSYRSSLMRTWVKKTPKNDPNALRKKNLAFESKFFKEDLYGSKAEKIGSIFWLGKFYLLNGRYDHAAQAIEWYIARRVLRIRDPKIYTVLAYAYVAAEDYDNAQDPFLKAYKLDSQRSIDIKLLAQHFQQTGQPDKAINLYEEALKITPNPQLQQALDALTQVDQDRSA